MSRQMRFTTISPLPSGISRETVLDFLHDHVEMIDLNPLIVERHRIPPPEEGGGGDEEDERDCVWWSLKDRISYLPGGLVTGSVGYKAAFRDLPDGVQTHCYAPLGVDVRERWTLGGVLPGEPRAPLELGLLGLGAPREGLYIREDVQLTCNFFMATFVKKTLKKAHGDLVEKLCRKAAADAKAKSSGGSGGGGPDGGASSESSDARRDR
ncbi:hypothetical protein F5Y17DRAFT_460886 [Xylariaceae sp. FL0594]|nr:hypothetical protein F5Y17DRAFT_460886 [Xylariaceae sp. FL0594]